MAQSKLSIAQRNSWMGRRYGRLTVIENPAVHQKKVKCLCDCGTIKPVATSALSSGATTSCTCLNKEIVAKMNLTHGLTYTPIYRTWAGMVNRCHNPSNSSFKDYGGRGIFVCEEWRDFTVFLADMGDRPSIKHQIDRVDNDKGYAPGNCIWATSQENSLHRRSTKNLCIFGMVKPVSVWAKETGISPYTIYSWVNNPKFSQHIIEQKILNRNAMQ